jgi:hypothetical protein
MRALLLMSVIVSIASAPALAQTSIQEGVGASTSCVDISVNDQPALSYACLNQRLAAAAGAGNTPSIRLDAVAHAPSNQQLGQFNFSALSNRMGNALGKSATPQRPPPLAPLPLFGKPAPAH